MLNRERTHAIRQKETNSKKRERLNQRCMTPQSIGKSSVVQHTTTCTNLIQRRNPSLKITIISKHLKLLSVIVSHRNVDKD